MHAREIITLFGGQTTLASLLGKGQTTVSYWAKTGLIPPRWQPKLLDLAKERGIALSPRDFMGPHAKPIGDAIPVPKAASQKVPGTAVMPTSPFLFYGSPDGAIRVQVAVENETVWASQKGMADRKSVV